MNDKKLIMIDCSEFSVELDRLFRRDFQQYLYLLDLSIIGDFITEYIISNVNIFCVLDYLEWSNEIQEQNIKDFLYQYFCNHLPPIKRRAFELCCELTNDCLADVDVKGASLLISYVLDGDKI